MPIGDLTVTREYSCGCQVYEDETGKEFEERGLFCTPESHKERLTRGDYGQPCRLF